MLVVEDLRKTYRGGVRALDGLSIQARPGIFGLLGPNGAGKTTLMKILATMLEPDSGSAVLDGVDLIRDRDRARRLIGYLPQEFGVYPSLTAEQMLSYLATLKGITDRRERRSVVGALLERVNLERVRKRRLETFSGGMRQRFGIAQALLGEPRLLVVDEPTAGLDPEERARFHDLLSEMAGVDTVVLLSTHIVSDVASLCGQMAVVHDGRVLAVAAPREAIKRMHGRVWEAAISPHEVPRLKASLDVLSTRIVDGESHVRVFSLDGRPDADFELAQPSLEDFYFSLVRTATGGA